MATVGVKGWNTAERFHWLFLLDEYSMMDTILWRFYIALRLQCCRLVYVQCTVAIIYDCVSELCDILYTCLDLWITEQMYYGAELSWVRFNVALGTTLVTSDIFLQVCWPSQQCQSTHRQWNPYSRGSNCCPIMDVGQLPLQNAATTQTMLNDEFENSADLCRATNLLPKCTRMHQTVYYIWTRKLCYSKDDRAMRAI